MRQLKHLSPSALFLWEKNPEEFYLQRLSERRTEKTPQEQPAAAGSAFDAYVKSALNYVLYGNSKPDYAFEALFEAQVEPQNRDWARGAGAYIFDCYVQSGFYRSLLKKLLSASTDPRFEFSVEADILGVPFLGKPDLQFVTGGGVHVVHDWKVNGFCSKYTTSPHKSYRLCRDGWIGQQSKSHDTEHREYLGVQLKDLEINTTYMEAAHPEWADQLTLYGWALGEQIGDEDVVLSIHQLVAKPFKPQPQLRVAEYRARVASEYQQTLAKRLVDCWTSITNGHVFKDSSREESDLRCQTLDDAAKGLVSDGSELETYFNEITRRPYRG